MTENDLEKAVKEISKDIDTLRTLKEQMDAVFYKSREDRLLQIRLVRLQTDIQNKLAIALAWTAIAGSFYNSRRTTTPLVLSRHYIYGDGNSIWSFCIDYH
jgi:hypothetical protein